MKIPCICDTTTPGAAGIRHSRTHWEAGSSDGWRAHSLRLCSCAACSLFLTRNHVNSSSFSAIQHGRGRRTNSASRDLPADQLRFVTAVDGQAVITWLALCIKDSGKMRYPADLRTRCHGDFRGALGLSLQPQHHAEQDKMATPAFQ